MGTSIDTVPWKSVNGTRGISKAVSIDGVFRSVNTFIIEGLQHRCDKNGVFRNVCDMDKGDRVKIERGPFAEFICTIDQIKDEQRAWVLINILQQQIRAKVYLTNISKIN